MNDVKKQIQSLVMDDKSHFETGVFFSEEELLSFSLFFFLFLSKARVYDV